MKKNVKVTLFFESVKNRSIVEELCERSGVTLEQFANQAVRNLLNYLILQVKNNENRSEETLPTHTAGAWEWRITAEDARTGENPVVDKE